MANACIYSHDLSNGGTAAHAQRGAQSEGNNEWSQFRGHNGRVALLAANLAEYTLISLFALPRGKGPCWAHPVISDGKLYLRWDENLYVYNIKE